MNVGVTRSVWIYLISFDLTLQCVVDVDLRTVLYNIDVLLLIKCVESFV